MTEREGRGQSDVHAIIDVTHAKYMRQGYDALSEQEQVVWLVFALWCEVMQGGLATFYYNVEDEQAVNTVWALSEIGAHRAAATLAKANQVLRRTKDDPLSLEEQFEIWKPITEETWREWEDELESDGPHAYFDLLAGYIDKHKGQLQSGND